MEFFTGGCFNLETSDRVHEHDPLHFVTILSDKESHISIRKDTICLAECENKPCTYICPSRVYFWKDQSIKVSYKRCVECGACIWGCPYENIDWHYPRGGHGIIYNY